MWGVESGECLQILEGHSDEIFSCAFNYDGDTIITGSKDNTCRIWKTNRALHSVLQFDSGSRAGEQSLQDLETTSVEGVGK